MVYEQFAKPGVVWIDETNSLGKNPSMQEIEIKIFAQMLLKYPVPVDAAFPLTNVFEDKIKQIRKNENWETNPAGTFTSSTNALATLAKYFPEALYSPVDCPRCTRHQSLDVIIIHLNDAHKISREEIADWIETLHIDTTIKLGENA